MNRPFGEVIMDLSPTQSPIQGVAVLPDNKTLFVGAVSTDRGTPTLVSVDMDSGEVIDIHESADNHSNSIWKIAVSPDGGNLLYVKQDIKKGNTFKLVNRHLRAKSSTTLYACDDLESLKGFDISPDGRLAIGIGSTVHFWNIGQNKKTDEIVLPEERSISDNYCFTSVCFSPNSERMAVSGLKQGEVLVYGFVENRVTNRLRATFDYPGKMAFSHNDRFVIAADNWGRGVFIWEMDSGRRFKADYFNKEMEKIACFDLSSNDANWLALGMTTSVVKLITLDNRKRLMRDKRHKGRITDLCLTSDGKKLISAGDDGHVLVRCVEK